MNVHGDAYDYSLITEYKNDRIRYPIRCKKHDYVFLQTFNNHIKGKQGCPICGREKCAKSREMSFEKYVELAKEFGYNSNIGVNNGSSTIYKKL